MTTATYRPEEILGPLGEVERKNAPPLLYLAGDEDLLRRGPRVSIVGTRSPSQHGAERARLYATELGRSGIVVVSGLALGIDAVAHESAMGSGGRTIAVLGTGIDVFYPARHRELQRRIARDHLLVSQFPPGTPVRRQNFPIRNRTMALLTDATIIIEAGETSGTLHQGWEALRLGRVLFLDEAVAANPDLEWPREMIHYGAQVLSPQTIGAVVDELPQLASLADVDL